MIGPVLCYIDTRQSFFNSLVSIIVRPTSGHFQPAAGLSGIPFEVPHSLASFKKKQI